MPARTQPMIRRGINRLNETIRRYKNEYASLAVIESTVASAAQAVNSAWQAYQAAAIGGDKERKERDESVSKLVSWIQQWRPVIMILIPGAECNIHSLPAQGSTPDDVIQTAGDMLEFIINNPAAESFRSSAIEDLGDGLTSAKKETADATAALPAESVARMEYGEACLRANSILVRSSEIIRSIFGRTSPEYKQFLTRASAGEEEEMETETLTGEQ